MSWLEQWHPWRAPIRQWGLGFAPTDYVVHQCAIGHCVDVMAAHKVPQMVDFVTSRPTPPTPPHPTASRPSQLPPLLSIMTAERDGKKYLEIQPSEIEKVSYNKNQ